MSVWLYFYKPNHEFSLNKSIYIEDLQKFFTDFLFKFDKTLHSGVFYIPILSGGSGDQGEKRGMDSFSGLCKYVF